MVQMCDDFHSIDRQVQASQAACVLYNQSMVLLTLARGATVSPLQSGSYLASEDHVNWPTKALIDTDAY